MSKAERAPGRQFSLREATPAAGAPLSSGSSFLLLLLLILSGHGREAVRGCVNANWHFNSQLLISDCNASARDTGVLLSITIIKLRLSSCK